MADHLARLAAAERCPVVLVAGDFKESVPVATAQEAREIPRFVERLAASGTKAGLPELRLEIVVGNHDAGLRPLLPPSVRMHPAAGALLSTPGGTVGVFHGHAWPSEAVAAADELVAAHTHPSVALADPLGHAHVEPCWVRGPASRQARRRYPDAPAHQRVTILPPFNPLLGGACVNVDGLLGPGGKMVDLEAAELFLVDGTNLGSLRHLPEPPKDWVRRRKAPKGEDL